MTLTHHNPDTDPAQQQDGPSITPDASPWTTGRKITAVVAGALVAGAGIAGGVKAFGHDQTPAQGMEQGDPATDPSVPPTQSPDPNMSPTSIPSLEPSQTSTATPSETSAPTQKTSEQIRAITDMGEYNKLSIQERLQANWALFKHVRDDGYYNWALSVQVDPNKPYSGFYDWSPLKNQPTPTDSGDKIVQSMIFGWAVALGETTDWQADDRNGSRAIDKVGAEQTIAGLVYDPNGAGTQSIVKSLTQSLETSNWEAYQQDQFLNIKVVDTKEGDNGAPITSDDGNPAKWVTITNTQDPEGKTSTYKFEYITFTTDDGTEQGQWVPTAVTDN